jgi:hypothetical protein
MDEMKLVRSHVERCLQDVWNVCRVSADSDGDYPFPHGTAACYVRIEPGDPMVIRVFAYAVVGVGRSAKLLAELNDIDGRCRTVSLSWHADAVIVEQVMHVNGVKRSTLAQACAAVGSVADDIGTMIAAVYGGATPFDTDDAAARPDREAS